MAYRTHKTLAANGSSASEVLNGRTLLKSIMSTVFAVMAMAAISLAAEPPDAPSSIIRSDAPMIEATTPAPVARGAEARPIDTRFVSLAFISTGSTFADSYTTLFARQNWLAHKQGVCNVEVQSAYLYGTHPTVARAYAVASVKSAGAIFASYYLRKHHSRFWALPFAANSIVSLEGVTQNMVECN